MKLLLVEEDAATITILSKILAQHHYTLDIARDGEAGWAYGSVYEYDLLLLNVRLPKLNGIQLCQRFREEGYTFPLLLLAAQSLGNITVQGLDAGADDVVIQPFDPDELAARIRALLRRGSASPFPLLTWGELCLNPSTYEVTYGPSPLSLTTKEYELLELFLRDSQRMLSTDDILDKLWASEEFPAEATVRSHIRRLRQKLTAVGAPTDFIATIHGRGYCLSTLGQSYGLEPAPPSSPASKGLSHPLTQQPLVWIVVESKGNKARFEQAATRQGLSIQITRSLEHLDEWLKTARYGGPYPDGIIIDLPSLLQTAGLREGLISLKSFLSRYPDLPTVVTGASMEWSDRLDLLGQGGSLLFESSQDPQQAIAVIATLCVQQYPRSPKIMVVDEDEEWLKVLPADLNTWGFKVTTLADVQQVWGVLQAVRPDVLVLAVEMHPFRGLRLNGLELCQILRSDLNWLRLPILGVSSLTEPNIQHRMFTAGVDDVLCKPLKGMDLAQRILLRLQRIHTRAGHHHLGSSSAAV